MKLWKIGLLLLIAMAFTACNRTKSGTANAAPETDFEFADGKITKYIGTAAVVVIPSQIQGQAVNEIWHNAFAEQQLTSVTIGNGVTMIRSGAFFNTELTSVTIPSSVVEIEDYAFSGNPQLTSITIGANVTLQGVTLSPMGQASPNDFGTVYNNNGKQAGTYTLNNGVWSLGGTALSAPQAAEETDWAAFAAMQDAIDAELKWWDDTPMFTDSGDQVWNYNNTNITTIWSKGMLSISGNGAVEGNYNDGSYPWGIPMLDVFVLVIGNGITEIKYEAFKYKQLETVSIADSVTTIGRDAFKGNPLKSITIGANVELGLFDEYDGISLYAFDKTFDDTYNNGGKQAGTYFFENGVWRKAEAVG